MAHTGCDANDAHQNDVRVVWKRLALREPTLLRFVLISAHGHQSVSEFCCKDSHLTVLTMVTLSKHTVHSAKHSFKSSFTVATVLEV